MNEILAPLPLTPILRKLLGVLYEEHIISRERISTALYGVHHDRDRRDVDRMIDVHLGRLRQRLKAEGVVISVTRAIGWYLKAEDKEKLRAWLERCP